MMTRNRIHIVVLLVALCVPALAQEEKKMSCDGNWNGDRASHCVIKEQTITATGATVTVDGRKNGGVTVKGWERNQILIRSKIQTWADTDAEAKAMVDQIRVETGGANIHAEGPEMENRKGWAVSYEVFVPRNSNLSLKSHNGGIGISDVRGQIEFSAVNGGVSLNRLAGNVKGVTRNGGLSIDLAGNRWDGEGMDVKTTNGGVKLTVPESYSAHLETGTVNGGMKIDIPITVQGEIKRELSVNLGGGGATIRAFTTNGGITIRGKA